MYQSDLTVFNSDITYILLQIFMKLALLQSVCLRQFAHTQLNLSVISSNKSSEN